MAGANNYKLLIEGELSTKNIELRILELQKKTKLILNFELNQNDIQKLNGILDKLRGGGNTIGKIKLFEDDAGGISKALIEYKNQAGQIEKTTKSINSEVIHTKERYIELAKIEAQIAKIEKDRVILTAKNADEMARAALNAEKFLAKSANMNQKDSSVMAAVSTAQQIKVAVSQGDIAKVRELNNQLAIQKSALSGVKSGIDSWASGMKNAIKQTIEYSLSIGLVYGALNQLKQGIQYVIDLNKQMTNIQVLQVEGAKTPEEVGALALQYNNLAKEMGATTIEVASGSVEWLFN